MWDVIVNMQGLQEIRVRFRSPFHDWKGWKGKDILDPMWKIARPLKVFEVDAPWIAAEMSFETDETRKKSHFKLLGSA